MACMCALSYVLHVEHECNIIPSQASHMLIYRNFLNDTQLPDYLKYLKILNYLICAYLSANRRRYWRRKGKTA